VTAVDLDAYLGRIGYDGPLEPTLDVLSALQLAHLTHIPFSTVDALFFPPTPLSLTDIEAKLVHHRGGGYCLEHHLLFATVLETLGFQVTMHLSHVRNGGPVARPRGIPRPHLVLLVELAGCQWLTDVSFGGGVLQPIRLRAGETVNQYGWTFRLIRDGADFVLQTLRLDDWLDLYAFPLAPKTHADLIVMHHFARTHPQSGLLNLFWAHRTDISSRWTFWAHWLDGPLHGVLIEHRVDGSITELPVDAADHVRVLADRFGMHLPAGARFPDNRPEPLDMAMSALSRYGPKGDAKWASNGATPAPNGSGG
jgi:N-hydroxyarylamine O-acetyltransferase